MGPNTGKDPGLTHIPNLYTSRIYNNVSILLEHYWFQTKTKAKTKLEIKNDFKVKSPTLIQVI